MATVNKNFKIKNGLVVEGTTATVNNFDILTKSSADQSYITTLVGGSGTSTNTPDTLVLRDSNGDFAAGTITATSFVGDLTGDVLGDVTGTVSDISNHDTDSLSEGVTNLYFTDARALSATSAAYDPAGSASTAEANANTYTDGEISTLESSLQSYADTAEADAITSANSYTDGEIRTLEGSLQTYADDAEAAANSYTDSLVGDATVDGTGGNTITDRIATAVADLVDSAPATLDTLNELAAALNDNPDIISDLTTSIGEKVAKSGDTMTGALVLSGDPTLALHAATKQYVDAAESDAVTTANSYTDGRETAITTAYEAYADQAETDANTYTDGQISTVNTTIGALDTDDVAEGSNQYFTDARAKTSAADLLTNASLTNITISGDGTGLTITAENGVADSDTDDLAEGSTNLYFTDARAQAAVATDISDAVAAGDGTATPTYLAVDVNSVALQVAATQSVATASQVVAYSWALADYGSAELVVKVGDGTNTEISKVLLTLDSSNNIAITEYGNVQTSGSLSSVSAGINGTDIELLVTTENNNSDVTVTGTLMV